MKILIVDSYNMIHRARHGFTFSENNVVFGFFRCLKAEISRHNPDMVFLVSEGRPKHRYEISEDYKANRKKEKDEDFLRQLSEIFDLCQYLPVTVIRHPDFECDDVIAMLCSKFAKEEITICSSDSDFIQLLENQNISLWNPVKKKFIDKWPVDYCTWKSLKGDATDNISGVKGVGEKTAFKLAASSQDLQEFFLKKPTAKKDFESSMALIRLATIDPEDSSLQTSKYRFDEINLLESFNRLSFKSITGKSWPSWRDTMENLDNYGKSTDII